ncbi:MAG: hypothetical protein ACK4WM_06740 [Thermoflexales bacterium]
MEVLLRLLQELRVVLVAVAVLLAVTFLVIALNAWQELGRAVFRFERALIRRRLVVALVRSGLFAVLAAAALSLPERMVLPAGESSSAPKVRLATPEAQPTTILPTPVPTADLSSAALAELSEPPTPTPDQVLAALLGTPTPTAEPIMPVLVAAPSLPSTPTPSPTSVPERGLIPLEPLVPTLAPLPPSPTDAAPSVVLVADCPNPDAQITVPLAGQSVRGRISIQGTAGFAPGGKYKLEILRPGVEGWAFLWEGFSEVKGGVLMPDFNADLFMPGVHVLRLLIVDAAGQETNAVCRVPIRIGE